MSALRSVMSLRTVRHCNINTYRPLISGFNQSSPFFSTKRALSTIEHSSNTQPQNSSASAPKQIDDLKYLKYDSAGSNGLYAIIRLHNFPYLVTKGDKIILPTKMKGVKTGDQLVMNNVTTIGSRNFTYNDDKGINPEVFDIKASVVEITKEPAYEVYRKKQRCRRLKTIPVQNHQTILMINELRLK